MDFAYSEDQEALRELARKILEELVTHERLKEIERGDDRVDRELWTELAKANLLGIPFDESLGGSGMGLMELALLLEEVGRSVAPVPVYETVVLGGLPIAEFGSDAQKRQWIPAICAGETVLTAALAEIGNEDPTTPLAEARSDAGAWVLSGRKGLVPMAHVAERVLVPARVPGGLGVFLVDPAAAGVKRVRQQVTSGEPQFVLELEGVRVEDADVLGSPGEQGAAIVRWMVERATAALCATALGVSDRALAMTAAYTTERRQFDRPIGSFQAVHQRAADSFIDVLSMRLTMLRAVHLLTRNQDATDALAVAKYWASEAGNRVTYACQHLHGGIGLDIDYPVHRYFLWARQISMTLGSATHHLVTIGTHLART